jgi:hypothetical protein
MEHDSSGWTGVSNPVRIDRAKYFQQRTRARPGPAMGKARPLWFLSLLLVVGVGEMIAQFTLGKAYPACDDNAASAALAKLYDNRRLLHAIDVRALRLLSGGLKGRYCSATVKWDNGSETKVHFEFYRSGRQNQYLYMWIDYNGGMRGPSF